MKNGIQMHLHPEFHSEIKEIKAARIVIGKEKMGRLTDKRLSKTIAKILREDIRGIRSLIINAEIDLNDD